MLCGCLLPVGSSSEEQLYPLLPEPHIPGLANRSLIERLPMKVTFTKSLISFIFPKLRMNFCPICYYDSTDQTTLLRQVILPSSLLRLCAHVASSLLSGTPFIPSGASSTSSARRTSWILASPFSVFSEVFLPLSWLQTPYITNLPSKKYFY